MFMPKAVVIIFCSLLGIVCLVFVASFIANFLLSQKIKQEVTELFAQAPERKGTVTKAQLGGLPVPVQKWLEYAQVIGKDKINTARFKEKAALRLKPENAWMSEEAEQYFTADKPGFIWHAKIKAAPFVFIAGRDKYYMGKGNMLIKPLSLITAADATGPEIDQGTLLRFLAESVWIPTAVLNDYIKWEAIDANSAKATMSYAGTTASGVFTFNDKGEVTNFTAKRFMDSNGSYSMETWSIEMHTYREFDGIKIPSRAEVTWKLTGGDFTWHRLEILDAKYNTREMY